MCASGRGAVQLDKHNGHVPFRDAASAADMKPSIATASASGAAMSRHVHDESEADRSYEDAMEQQQQEHDIYEDCGPIITVDDLPDPTMRECESKGCKSRAR